MTQHILGRPEDNANNRTWRMITREREGVREQEGSLCALQGGSGFKGNSVIGYEIGVII